jgi:DinB superfamily
MLTVAPTDRRAQLIAAADAYFHGLARKDVSQVPWHDDVAFRGPLAPGFPDAMRGRVAVAGFFAALYPVLGDITVIDHHVNEGATSIATRADIAIVNPPCVLRVVDRFVVDEHGAIREQENHYDPRPALAPPSGTLSPQERDMLIDLLVSSQSALVSAVVGVSPAEWTRDPGAGRWSIAQCAEHLALSEEGLLAIVRTQILTSPPAVDAAAVVRGRDGVVVSAMRDRSHRSQTFEALMPRTPAATPAAFIAAFLSRRAATLRYVRETADPLHHHVAPLGPLGDLDAYQWLLLLASHTERHVQQIDEVKQAA